MKRFINLLILLVLSSASVFADDNTNLSFLWPNPVGGSNENAFGGRVDYDHSKPTPFAFFSPSENDKIRNDYNVIMLRYEQENKSNVQIVLNEKIIENDTIIITGFRLHKNRNEVSELTLGFKNDYVYTVDKTFNNLYYDQENKISYDTELTTDTIIATDEMVGSGFIKLDVSSNSRTNLMITKIEILHDKYRPRLLYVSPASGETIQSLPDNKIIFKTNYDDKCRSFYVTVPSAYDKKSYISTPIKDSEGNWVADFGNEDIVFFKGKTYDVTIQGYDGVNDYSNKVNKPLIVTYFGAKEVPYVNIPYHQYPSENEVISSLSDNKVTVDFESTVSAYDVKIAVDGGEFVSLPNTNYVAATVSKNHEITIPEEKLKACKTGFKLHIYATDANGVKVGDEVNEEYVEVRFSCSIPRDFTISPAGGECDEIKELTFSSPDGIRYLSSISLELNGSPLDGSWSTTESVPEVKFTLNQSKNSYGNYTLKVKEGTFDIGGGYKNMEKTVSYKVNPYSAVGVEKQEPLQTETIKDLEDNVVKVVFTDDAKVSKVEIVSDSGSSVVEPENLVPVKDTYSKEWCITVPASVLENAVNGFSLNIYANDNKGKKIVGDDKTKEYVVVTFSCSIPRNFTIVPEGGEYEELKEITFTSEDGIKVKDINAQLEWDTSVSLFAGRWETVDEKTVKYVFNTPVTKVGTYTMKVSEGTFEIGVGYKNVEKSVTYTIKKAYKVTITPDPSKTWESLYEFTVTLDEEAEEGANIRQHKDYYPRLIDEKGNTISIANAPEPVPETNNSFTVRLDKVINKSGTYVLKFPKSCFYIGSFYAPQESPEFSFVYQVKESEKLYGKITFGVYSSDLIEYTETFETKELGGNDVFDVVVQFDDCSQVTINGDYSGKVTIKDSEDNNAAEATPSLGLTKNIRFKINKKITENGIYRMWIPANLFKVKLPNTSAMLYDKEMVLTFKVNKNYSAIEVVDNDNNDFTTVYNLHGVKVASGRREAVLDGLKGLYIVNGKKILLK